MIDDYHHKIPQGTATDQKDETDRPLIWLIRTVLPITAAVSLYLCHHVLYRLLCQIIYP